MWWNTHSTLVAPRTLFVRACAQNVWFTTTADFEPQYVHVHGKNNRTTDLLSRWLDTFCCFC